MGMLAVGMPSWEYGLLASVHFVFAIRFEFNGKEKWNILLYFRVQIP